MIKFLELTLIWSFLISQLFHWSLCFCLLDDRPALRWSRKSQHSRMHELKIEFFKNYNLERNSFFIIFSYSFLYSSKTQTTIQRIVSKILSVYQCCQCVYLIALIRHQRNVNLEHKMAAGRPSNAGGIILFNFLFSSFSIFIHSLKLH